MLDDEECTVSKEYVMGLIAEKDILEKKIAELSDYLKSQNIDLNESVVDNQGFPRADIDVYNVRHTKHKIICLRNDHKNLMAQIESGLHMLHAKEKSEGVFRMDTYAGSSSQDQQLKPFAKVESVTNGSPAYNAGLEQSDDILEFGSINYDNFINMQNIASVVQHSVERPLRITVRRQGTQMRVSLTPCTWSGPGLLGCHIVASKIS